MIKLTAAERFHLEALPEDDGDSSMHPVGNGLDTVVLEGLLDKGLACWTGNPHFPLWWRTKAGDRALETAETGSHGN
jgi:hypothetical protein